MPENETRFDRALARVAKFERWGRTGGPLDAAYQRLGEAQQELYDAVSGGETIHHHQESSRILPPLPRPVQRAVNVVILGAVLTACALENESSPVSIPDSGPSHGDYPEATTEDFCRIYDQAHADQSWSLGEQESFEAQKAWLREEYQQAAKEAGFKECRLHLAKVGEEVKASLVNVVGDKVKSFVLKEGKLDEIPASKATEEAPEKEAEKIVEVTPPRSFIVHQVREGETPGGIAEFYFGDPTRYSEILPSDQDPTKLRVGQELLVPFDAFPIGGPGLEMREEFPFGLRLYSQEWTREEALEIWNLLLAVQPEVEGILGPIPGYRQGRILDVYSLSPEARKVACGGAPLYGRDVPRLTMWFGPSDNCLTAEKVAHELVNVIGLPKHQEWYGLTYFVGMKVGGSLDTLDYEAEKSLYAELNVSSVRNEVLDLREPNDFRLAFMPWWILDQEHPGVIAHLAQSYYRWVEETGQLEVSEEKVIGWVEKVMPGFGEWLENQHGLHVPADQISGHRLELGGPRGPSFIKDLSWKDENPLPVMKEALEHFDDAFGVPPGLEGGVIRVAKSSNPTRQLPAGAFCDAHELLKGGECRLELGFLDPQTAHHELAHELLPRIGDASWDEGWAGLHECFATMGDPIVWMEHHDSIYDRQNTPQLLEEIRQDNFRDLEARPTSYFMAKMAWTRWYRMYPDSFKDVLERYWKAVVQDQQPTKGDLISWFDLYVEEKTGEENVFSEWMGKQYILNLQ